ncbi:MAG: hypothetical protein HFI92_02700 [Lachnospiraceae bacterium]|nr:hypothetical protein [Lachnospiraceae bacterium]
MAQTELDITKVMVLLQRRYNVIREISKLSKELSEALSRNDDVSTSMILQMRAEEMAKADECIHELWQLAEDDKEAQRELRLLVISEPEENAGESPEEKKIYEIRRKTQTMIEDIRALDQRISRKLAGDRSYYGK